LRARSKLHSIFVFFVFFCVFFLFLHVIGGNLTHYAIGAFAKSRGDGEVFNNKKIIMMMIKILTLLLLCVALADCRLTKVSHHGNEKFIILGKPFGAVPGALVTAQMRVSSSSAVSAHPLYLVLYTESQWSAIEEGAITDVKCMYPSAARYEFSERVQVQHRLVASDLYQAVAINCGQNDVELDGSIRFVNEGAAEQELSLDERNALSAYVSLWALCAALGLYYGYLWYRDVKQGGRGDSERFHDVSRVASERRGFVPLQRLAAAVIAMKSVEYALYAIYYAVYRGSGEPLDVLEAVAAWLGVATDSTLLFFATLLSLGWGVVRSELWSRQRHMLWGTTALYVVLAGLVTYCATPRVICYSYALSFNIVRVLLAGGLTVMLNALVERLRRDLLDHRLGDHGRYIRPKILLLFRMRWTFIAFLLLPVLFAGFAAFVLDWRSRTIFAIVVDQLCVVAALISIALNMRPSPRNRRRLFCYYSGSGAPSVTDFSSPSFPALFMNVASASAQNTLPPAHHHVHRLERHDNVERQQRRDDHDHDHDDAFASSSTTSRDAMDESGHSDIVEIDMRHRPSSSALTSSSPSTSSDEEESSDEEIDLALSFMK
jgi:GOST, seven transmembrane domain